MSKEDLPEPTEPEKTEEPVQPEGPPRRNKNLPVKCPYCERHLSIKGIKAHIRLKHLDQFTKEGYSGLENRAGKVDPNFYVTPDKEEAKRKPVPRVKVEFQGNLGVDNVTEQNQGQAQAQPVQETSPCPACGYPLKEGMNHCPNCGKEINWV